MDYNRYMQNKQDIYIIFVENYTNKNKIYIDKTRYICYNQDIN